jgi:chorismate mutase
VKTRPVLPALATFGLALIALLPPSASADDAAREPLYDLVDTATQRLQTADPVAASKWLGGGPITDPARVQQVLQSVAADAESSGVPSDFVTSVFTDQINATEAIQYSRFSWWKLNPADAPASAPDLSASRALIDGLNAAMVGQIVAQWPVLHAPDCAARLGAAKAAVADQRQLDPLYRQALDAATRSYCTG